MHRSSIGHSPHKRSDGRKRSHSDVRGDEFIECAALEDPFQRPVHTSISSSQALPPKGKFLFPFGKEKRTSVPKIHVQRETTVSSEQARKPSHESWMSGSTAITRPAHAVYGGENSRAKDSDASLFDGRMV